MPKPPDDLGTSLRERGEAGARVRIVAGQARGRRLAVPSGQGVRPTPDRVREALFSILGASLVEGARVLDLFAGSGALGLEALSRGAASAVFVERDPRTSALVTANAGAVGLGDRAFVLRGDALRLPRRFAREGRCFDLVFLDPPYHAALLEPALHVLADCGILAPEATVVAEHPAGQAPRVAEPRWQVDDRRAYGDVGLTFFRWTPLQER